MMSTERYFGSDGWLRESTSYLGVKEVQDDLLNSETPKCVYTRTKNYME